MNMLDASGIEERAGVIIWLELCFGTVANILVHVWGMLWVHWWGVTIFQEDGGHIAIHDEVASAFGVVPGQVHAIKFCNLPVCSNNIVMLECHEEVVGMALFAVLDVKVIDNEDEHMGCQVCCHRPGMVAHWK